MAKHVHAVADTESDQSTLQTAPKDASASAKSVSKVIICYTDGTFEMLNEA
jgi:hypothetical protein